MKIEYFNSECPLSSEKIDLTAVFLHTELAQYGDPQKSITKAINYALDPSEGKGGLVAIASEKERMIGAVVINRTGMDDYIPENILVYIAVHHDYRGRGIGKQLLSAVIEATQGDIALHVEPDNPAVSLYRNVGFSNKYLEMRLIKKEV